MQISYDNVSLSTSPYIVEKLSNDDVPNREVFLYQLARQRGANLINTEYKAKVFRLSGTIVGTDQADLDAKKHEFKELLSRVGKNLDIDDGAGTLRYVATATKITMPKEHFHISFIPFEVEFVVPSGVGTDIAETNDITTGVATLINTDQTDVLGSVAPKMRTKLNLTAESGCTKLEFLCNGDKLTLDYTFVSGDEIIIDENSLKVTVNGIEQPYTGIFPRFGLGANVYIFQFTGTSIEYTSTFSYLKTYI